MSEFLSAQNILHALEIGAIVWGVITGAFKLGSTANQLTNVIVEQTKTQERYEQQLIDLKVEVRTSFDKVGSILTVLAVQNNRLDMLDKSYDELRRGIGYINGATPR
jgi:hypothetical protein